MPTIPWSRYPWLTPALKRKLSTMIINLPARAAKSLAHRYASSEMAPGCVLFYRDHHPFGAYLLTRGTVSLEQGRGRRAGRGVVIEGPALLGFDHAVKREAYPITARTLTQASVCLIPAPDASKIKMSHGQQGASAA